MKNITLLFLLVSFAYIKSQPTGYTYGKMITIQGSKVPSNLSNFPVLINIQDNALKSTSNGGRIYNPNGYDIVFYLTDCFTKLDHQIEKYDPVTGTLICWVRMPLLLGGINSGLYMFYSNSTVTANPSVNTVWDNNFVSRYHMNNPPNGTTMDYTGNGNSSINTNITSSASATGKIGDAVSFNGSQYIQLPTTNNPGNYWTITCWIKSNQTDNNYHGFIGSDNNANPCCINRSAGLWVYQYTRVHGGFGNGSTWCSWVSSPNVITNGTNANWHHLAYTYDGTAQVLWVDGVKTYSMAACSPTTPVNNSITYLGRRDNYYTGILDEVGISKIKRSDSWIITEYNNQSDPASFYTVGSETSASSLCSVLPIELVDFYAIPLDDRIELHWKTATQINNDYFVIEKSMDAQNWKQLVMVKGAGTYYTPIDYIEIDFQPNKGINYYRLKQVDLNGNSSYSNIISINYSLINKQASNDQEPKIFPNPVEQKDILNIQFPSFHTEALVIMRDIMGREVFSKIIAFEENNLLYAIPIDNEIPAGIYIITASSNKNILFSKKVIVK